MRGYPLLSVSRSHMELRALQGGSPLNWSPCHSSCLPFWGLLPPGFQVSHLHTADPQSQDYVLMLTTVLVVITNVQRRLKNLKASSYSNILAWHGSFSFFLIFYGKLERTEHLSLTFSWSVCLFLTSIPYFHLYMNRWLQPPFQSLIKTNHKALNSHDPDTGLAQPSIACYWHCWST